MFHPCVSPIPESCLDIGRYRVPILNDEFNDVTLSYPDPAVRETKAQHFLKEQLLNGTQQRILSTCLVIRPVSSDHTDFIREFNKIIKGN